MSRGFDLVLVARRRVVEDLKSRFLPPGDSFSSGAEPGVRGVLGVLGVEGILDTVITIKSIHVQMIYLLRLIPVF